MKQINAKFTQGKFFYAYMLTNYAKIKFIDENFNVFKYIILSHSAILYL